MSEKKEPKFPYLHGFTDEEQNRLWKQAEFSEHLIYHNVDFSEQSQILEVGCGVGAQTSILLRRYPHLQVTSIDASPEQLATCKKNLDTIPYAKGRFELKQMSATDLDLPINTYDGAFICWVLEHLSLAERPGQSFERAS